jgi:hypothetical protein
MLGVSGRAYPPDRSAPAKTRRSQRRHDLILRGHGSNPNEVSRSTDRPSTSVVLAEQEKNAGRRSSIDNGGDRVASAEVATLYLLTVVRALQARFG